MAKTKLKEILIKKRISQTELYNLIREKCNSHLGQDVISRIVNGKKKNYEIFTLLKTQRLKNFDILNEVQEALNMTRGDIDLGIG